MNYTRFLSHKLLDLCFRLGTMESVLEFHAMVAAKETELKALLKEKEDLQCRLAEWELERLTLELQLSTAQHDMAAAEAKNAAMKREDMSNSLLLREVSGAVGIVGASCNTAKSVIKTMQTTTTRLEDMLTAHKQRMEGWMAILHPTSENADVKAVCATEELEDELASGLVELDYTTTMHAGVANKIVTLQQQIFNLRMETAKHTAQIQALEPRVQTGRASLAALKASAGLSTAPISLPPDAKRYKQTTLATKRP